MRTQHSACQWGPPTSPDLLLSLSPHGSKKLGLALPGSAQPGPVYTKPSLPGRGGTSQAVRPPECWSRALDAQEKPKVAGAAGGGGNWRQATSFLRSLSITGKAGQLKCQGQPAVGVGVGSRPAYTLRVLGGVTGPAPLSPMNCSTLVSPRGKKWLPAVGGQFPPVFSLYWAALPGLQVAGQ